tara:strand:+ start:73 stop:465 length:393 start_codon:yes stop_codon:yes gene_type:complete
MATIFSRILTGDLPAFKVFEDENHLALLDIFPLAYGHVLVVPKREVDYIFDLETHEYLALFEFAKRVAKAMDKVIVCERIGIAVIGLEVPHAHIHLVPLQSVSDINFEKDKLKFSDEKMRDIAERINEFI